MLVFVLEDINSARQALSSLQYAAAEIRPSCSPLTCTVERPAKDLGGVCMQIWGHLTLLFPSGILHFILKHL